MFILILDESTFAREAVGSALGHAGHHVLAARDLRDLARPLAPPDLVLLELQLRDIRGDEVARLLRSGWGVRCPILLVSSAPEGVLAARAEAAQLAGFVSKRAGLTAVVSAARRAVGDRGAAVSVASPELASRFDVLALARVRAVRAFQAGDPASLVAILHVLAGDADLLGKSGIAEAARACVAVARDPRSLAAAVDDLARLTGDALAQVELSATADRTRR